MDIGVAGGFSPTYQPIWKNTHSHQIRSIFPNEDEMKIWNHHLGPRFVV